MQDTSLLALPDDALVAVLAYLPPRELFSCRVVCRRLRDVCLHPDLWRSVRLRLRGPGLLRAALRLAPRVREIGPNVADLASVSSLVSGTTCVIAKLGLHVHTRDDVTAAMSVLNKVTALGGLNDIDLVVWKVSVEDVLPLLRKVYDLSDLRELYIWFIFDSPVSTSWRALQGKSSLTRLTYGAPTCDPILEMLIRSHALTLEHIHLPKMKELPVSWLKEVLNLRSLTCPADKDLSQLHSLPKLNTIELLPVVNTGRSRPVPLPLGEADYETFEDNIFASGTLTFLRRASQLRDVSLGCLGFQWPSAALPALSESPSARVVETLRLTSARITCEHEGWVLKQVAATLYRFLSLRTLHLDAVPSDTFLGAISPASAPSLATLKMLRSPTSCPHAWLHGPAVTDVLSRNCQLHLRLEGSRVALKGCDCVWCSRGCHTELQRRPSLMSAFSGHTRRAGCPSDCFQVAG